MAVADEWDVDLELLEGEDAAGLNAGDEVVLVRWGLVKITAKTGPLAFVGEYVPDGVLKKKKALHWLAACVRGVASFGSRLDARLLGSPTRYSPPRQPD